MLSWLETHDDFPPVWQALSNPNGLLAAGGNLSISRLRQAYQQGIYPWFSAEDPILWWSPSPRMVLNVDDFSPSHSFRKKLRQLEKHQTWGIYVDCAFDQVISNCASPRSAEHGTWIVPPMQAAYCAWHLKGDVHSIETWTHNDNGERAFLIGGLYGVSLGKMFFGESMFSCRTDASKVALAYLIRFLKIQGAPIIDCQQQTPHLAFLGAKPIERDIFLTQVNDLVKHPSLPLKKGRLMDSGDLMAIS